MVDPTKWSQAHDLYAIRLKILFAVHKTGPGPFKYDNPSVNNVKPIKIRFAKAGLKKSLKTCTEP